MLSSYRSHRYSYISTHVVHPIFRLDVYILGLFMTNCYTLINIVVVADMFFCNKYFRV